MCSLARHDISGQQVDGLVDTFKSVIEDNGGKIAKTENWGLKPLAYKIKKSRKAHFALMNIEAQHTAVGGNGTPNAAFDRHHPVYDGAGGRTRY